MDHAVDSVKKLEDALSEAVNAVVAAKPYDDERALLIAIDDYLDLYPPDPSKFNAISPDLPEAMAAALASALDLGLNISYAASEQANAENWATFAFDHLSVSEPGTPRARLARQRQASSHGKSPWAKLRKARDDKAMPPLLNALRGHAHRLSGELWTVARRAAKAGKLDMETQAVMQEVIREAGGNASALDLSAPEPPDDLRARIEEDAAQSKQPPPDASEPPPAEEEQPRKKVAPPTAAELLAARSSEELGILTHLDDRLAESLQAGDIRFVSTAWLLSQPENYRLERRQVLEAIETGPVGSDSGQCPLLSPAEAVALVRDCSRSVAALTCERYG